MKKQFLMFSLLASSFAVFASGTGDDAPVATARAEGEGNCCKHQLVKLKKFAGSKLKESGNKCCPRGNACRKGGERFCFKIKTAWGAFKNPHGTGANIAKAEERTRIAEELLGADDDRADVTEDRLTELLTAYRTAAKQVERDAVANLHFPTAADADNHVNVTREDLTGLVADDRTGREAAAKQVERDALANRLFPTQDEDDHEGVTEDILVGLFEERRAEAIQFERDAVANRLFGDRADADDGAVDLNRLVELLATDRSTKEAAATQTALNAVASRLFGVAGEEGVTEDRLAALLTDYRDADRSEQRASVSARSDIAQVVERWCAVAGLTTAIGFAAKLAKQVRK